MKHTILLSLLAVMTFSAKAQQEVDTTDWKSLYSAAKSSIEKTDYFNATRYLEMASNIRPSDTLQRNLAVCYFYRGYYKRCSDICFSVLSPDTLESDLFLLTRSLKNAGAEPEKQLVYQRMLFNKNPLNQTNTLNIAQNLMSMDSISVALDCLSKYCEIDSTNLSINELKAKAYLYNGNYDFAIGEYERVIAAGGVSPFNYYFLGFAAKYVGQYKKALENLTIANELTLNQNPNVLMQLGLVQMKIDSLKFAGSQNLNRAVNLMQPSSKSLKIIYYSMAEYYEYKNWRKALDYYLKIKDLTGIDAALSYRISTCYKMLKNTRKEMEYLSQFVDLSDDSVALNYAHKRIRQLRGDRFMNGE
ncbi:MAG: hypothetical protein IKQ46_11000 [Bacteroidales bacterium]|nr:hypothetical protein [Bacteroidales bacterium]